MTRAISQDIQNDLRALLVSGATYEEITARLGVSKATVHRYCKSWKIARPEHEAGRPTVLTDASKSLMKRMVLSGELNSGVEVQQHFRALSWVEVWNHPERPKSLGFKACHKEHIPALSVQLKKERLRWANAHRFWTVEDWRRVVFSDESKINIWGSDGVEFYWNLPGGPLQPHHVIPTVKYGGGSLMVWGCMTSRGVGSIGDIYGKMNAAGYINILKTKLEESLNRRGIDENNFIFQQDNDPKHTAKSTKAYLAEEKGYTVLPWPSQSPDLNPIEHLWRHLKIKLAQYDRRATSVHELWERVKVEWETFDEDICCKYIDSMPARVEAVINANGGNTRY